MVAILPSHSCSGYHTPQERLQACFQQLTQSHVAHHVKPNHL